MARMRIMVVDDDSVNLAAVEQELKSKYEVIPMATGQRAVKYLYQEKVDLILLDVQMPVMDGFETLKEIRRGKNGVTVPVIFITSRKDTNTILEGSKLGIMDYIVKPFEPEDLRFRIERVFKKLGILPMEKEELYEHIADISSDIRDGKIKPAIAKTDQILRYQADEEVLGRMRLAKQKFESGNIDEAANAVDRVMTFMERDMDDISKTMFPPISISEIQTRVTYAMDDLNNFKIHDSMDRLKDLLTYDLPDIIRRYVTQANSKLKDYDETEAIRILNLTLETLATLETEPKSEASEEPSPESNAANIGYRSKFFRK